MRTVLGKRMRVQFRAQDSSSWEPIRQVNVWHVPEDGSLHVDLWHTDAELEADLDPGSAVLYLDGRASARGWRTPKRWREAG